MSTEAVRPVLTIRQTEAIRLAIRCYLDFEDNDANTVRAMQNALRQVDVAEMETRRRRRKRGVTA